MGISIDFGDEQAQTTLSFPSGAGAAGSWDSSTWDVGSWGGSVTPFYAWQTVGAVGTAISLRMETVTNGIDVRHAATDYLYENGGVIV